MVLCENRRAGLCGDRSCRHCFERSFASFNDKNKVQCWSSKNGDVQPCDVTLSSEKKYWFLCNVCDHEFEIRIYSVTANLEKHKHWCSYCANQKICSNIDCKICKEKTFANHEKSIYWSKKNKLSPRDIYISTAKTFWFDCDKCNHSFETSPNKITRNLWCPYCCYPAKLLCKNSDCNMCLQRSFASHEKSKYWSDKNNVSPREVFKHTKKKYWMRCNYCDNEFNKSIDDITNVNGSWCPHCRYKTEKKMYEYLKKSFNVTNQAKFEWTYNSSTKKHSPFDFLLGDFNLIIEIDGIQHFEQVSNWNSPEKIQEKDIYKMKKAVDNNYSVLRFLQEDVLYDKNNWENKLLSNIKSFETPTIMCFGKIYECFNNNGLNIILID